jgi:hypothetical protein
VSTCRALVSARRTFRRRTTRLRLCFPILYTELSPPCRCTNVRLQRSLRYRHPQHSTHTKLSNQVITASRASATPKHARAPFGGCSAQKPRLARSPTSTCTAQLPFTDQSGRTHRCTRCAAYASPRQDLPATSTGAWGSMGTCSARRTAATPDPELAAAPAWQPCCRTRVVYARAAARSARTSPRGRPCAAHALATQPDTLARLLDAKRSDNSAPAVVAASPRHACRRRAWRRIAECTLVFRRCAASASQAKANDSHS